MPVVLFFLAIGFTNLDFVEPLIVIAGATKDKAIKDKATTRDKAAVSAVNKSLNTIKKVYKLLFIIGVKYKEIILLKDILRIKYEAYSGYYKAVAASRYYYSSFIKYFNLTRNLINLNYLFTYLLYD